MESRLQKALGFAALLTLMALSPVAVMAQVQNPLATPQPIWVTINASAQGNYPGGDVLFTVFAVNSGQPPSGNETIDSMTLTAPFQSNFAPGLPAVIIPGQSLLSTIHLEIPSDFSQKSFTANLVVKARLWNGTAYQGVTLTGVAVVDVFALPSQGTSQGAQNGGISMTLFAAGVGIPVIVAIILLALLVRARGSKRTGM